MTHLEFVVEFKDGSRDWLDPVDHDGVTEDDTNIVVEHHNGYVYTYEKSKIDRWTIRPYDPDTTYMTIEEYS